MVRRGRQAFTLIEILVVIGIILLLVGIGVIGFQHLDKATSEKATKTRLDVCTSILNEYETSVATLNSIEGAGPTGKPPSIYTSIAVGGRLNYSQLPNPGDVNLGSPNRSVPPVTTTATILQTCSHVPAVKTELAQLPAAAVLALSSGNNQPFVILDAWKNPIIYVPATGLPNVTAGGRTGLLVTAVDGRPFWASSGQDGNFQMGDDNVYSVPVNIGPPPTTP